jgi:hypothetical protein
MAVTADQLSKTGARGKELDMIVREHLTIIDDRLLKADRTWGRNVVAYDLPIMIPLPGLDKKDAQRIVYSAILRSLEKRKFEVRLLLDHQKTTLYIAWMTDLDVEEVEAMNTLIRSKRIAQEDVEKFMRQGAIDAPHAATAARAGQAQEAPPMRLATRQIMRPRGGVEQVVPRARGGAGSRSTPAGPVQAERELLGGEPHDT